MPKRSSRDLLLAGDIGATNARLRLYDGAQRVVHEAVFSSRQAPSLAPIVRAYLTAQKARVAAAVLGIAGPVVGGVVRATNLPWKVDERRLARDLGIPKVQLVNDLAALAIGCTRMGRASKVLVAKGSAVAGSNMAVIAAGTGLGEALLIWDGNGFIPCATEGGHADFGPNNDVEVHLWEHVRQQTVGEHVSNEDVLSGPGLGRMYDFFVDHMGPRARARENATIAPRLETGDRNALITELGLARESPAAARAVDLFASVYGAEAGNLVLHSLALGGLFVCGGIAARILPARKALFLAAMRNKGRMTKLLSKVPVVLVEDPLVGLVGAGHLAARLAAE
ncbi:MAG TPA: glucokinase [Polyangiaceae bacterium]|nr:glucokinase [Polyangiaceae bacterium]